MKLIIRIIASPFIFGICFIGNTCVAFNRTYLFIKHGGEWINYEKDETKTIKDVYDKLK